VPGLLLLLILRLAKVPGFSALQTAESATLSVLISVLLNLVPQGLTKIGPRFVLGAFDTGVSAWQFLIVCAAAVILGISSRSFAGLSSVFGLSSAVAATGSASSYPAMTR